LLKALSDQRKEMTMDHRLWHALLHLATHAARHLSGGHAKQASAPRNPNACAKCTTEVAAKAVTHCCEVKLCEKCIQEWFTTSYNRKEVLCVICDKKPVYVSGGGPYSYIA
jgi:hypothetical protein